MSERSRGQEHGTAVASCPGSRETNTDAQLGSSFLLLYLLGTCPKDSTTHIQDGSSSPQLNLSENAFRDAHVDPKPGQVVSQD